MSGPPRRLRWLLVSIGFVLAAAYALGGGSGFRQFRARVRSFLEPPTASEMRRAVTDTPALPAPVAPTDVATRTPVPGSEPATPAMTVALAAIVVAVALVLMFVSAGRRRGE